jgi:hemolysin activation/secretion protein
LNLRYDPIDGYVSFNNRGTDNVGELRLQAGVLLNSPLAQGERFILSGATTPQDPSELANGAGSLTFPIGAEGLTLNLGGSYTTIHPGQNLKPFDINGSTTAFNIGTRYPVWRSYDRNLAVTSRFDYRDETLTTSFGGSENFLSDDKLRVLRFGVDSDFQHDHGITAAVAELSFGLNAFGARDSGNNTRPLSRLNGSADFTKLNLDLSRQQFLPAGFGLNLAATAQITNQDLLSSEQFGLGGTGFGRVFNPSAVLGDSGYGLRAELQRTFLYHIKANPKPYFTQPYWFIDYGQVFRISPTSLEPGYSTLASTGFGVRQRVVRDMVFDLEAAFPLVQDNLIKDQGNRIFFALEGFF